MSFTKLFDSGFTQRNKDHFAALVSVAMEDGILTDDEKSFLTRVAQELGIPDTVFNTILKDYKIHPINPPASADKRIERFYDLTRMVYADQIEDASEVKLLTKIAVGLGYQTALVDQLVSTALNAVKNGANFNDFCKILES